jgi:hypothetical protein
MSLPATQVRKQRRNRQGLPPEEEVIFRRHHHWSVLVRMILFPLILTLLIFIVFLVIGAQLDAPAYDATLVTAAALVRLVLGGLVLVAIIGTAYQVWNWLADWIVLTNRRIIVREATPLLHESRREVPLGKVQNVITTLPGPLNMSLNFGQIVIDTAGLGTIRLNDVPDPGALRTLILAEQKKVLAVSQPSREQHRQEVIRSILYNTPPPPPPQGALAIQPSPREGFGVFNSLFPFRPQRDGMTVIWHRHWWFLVKREFIPLLIILLFEVVEVASVVFFNTIGSDRDPLDPILSALRPFLWLVVLIVALYQWEDWRNDYYEIRDDRLIDREALPLGLFEQTKETELRRITDIKNDLPSPLAMLLNYGDIVIKTPGEGASFTFDGVPNPREVLGEIMDRIEALRERDQLQTARDMQDLLRAYTREIQNWQAWQGQQLSDNS